MCVGPYVQGLKIGHDRNIGPQVEQDSGGCGDPYTQKNIAFHQKDISMQYCLCLCLYFNPGVDNVPKMEHTFQIYGKGYFAFQQQTQII